MVAVAGVERGIVDMTREVSRAEDARVGGLGAEDGEGDDHGR